MTNIAVAPNGTHYIVAGEGRLLRQRRDRTVDDWNVYAGDDWGLLGVAVTSAGNLAATHSDHRLYLFTPAGEIIKSIGNLGSEKHQFNAPRDIAADRFDNLYVADTMNHRIQMFNKELVFQESLNDGFKLPQGVHVTPDLRLMVADTGNNRVLVYERVEGKWKNVLTIDSLQAPYDVASDSKGNIIVADLIAQSVLVFDKRGKRKKVFDKLGNVHAVAVTNDNVILAVTPYQRVHELRLDR
jgi:DNA-binding beta-propeller fold protein YncE